MSGSMGAALSARSDLRRLDAACGLAMLLARIATDLRVFTFSDALIEVPPRQGFALRDVIVRSQPHNGTHLGAAVEALPETDRLIMISDEQAHDRIADPKAPLPYVINVATNKNGIGYGKWTHIDGWSEAIVDYIRASEAETARQRDPILLG